MPQITHRLHNHRPEADFALSFSRPPSNRASVEAGQFLETAEDSISQNEAAQVEAGEVITANSVALRLGKAALVENLQQEELARAAFHKFAGRVSVRQVLEHEPQKKEAAGPTLAMSITEAINGNKEADARVDISIGTATAEGYFKTGHITEVEKQLNENREVVQFGLTTESMHHDSLVLRPNRPPALKEFTLAEACNGFREQELAKSGMLEDGWFIAVSCVPERLPEHLLDYRGDGYFTGSMAFSAQGTTQQGPNLVTQTVFDKGTWADEKSPYHVRQAERFDIVAIGKVYERLGLEPPKSALEMLETPLWVPKDMMPNGMADFWRWVDEAADELRGVKVVRTEQQYIDRITQSRVREASLSDVKAHIKQELLAMDGTFTDDMQAIDALWELVRTHGVIESVSNHSISPIVFGPSAAVYIEEARHLASVGDITGMHRKLHMAEESAVISGCGGGSGGRKKNELSDSGNLDLLDSDDDNGSEESGDTESDNFGSLRFKCPKGHWNKRRPAKSPKDFEPKCKTCGTSVACKPEATTTEKPIFQSVGEQMVKFMAAIRAADSNKETRTEAAERTLDKVGAA